jgi:hypothetical protein
MAYEYVRDYYGVPAATGRKVVMNGRPGIIAEDRGHYIGVNFDDQPPGTVVNAHPTWKMTYGDMGAVRKLPARQARAKGRYARFREFGDGFDSFLDYCRWDAHPDRSWNQH